MGPTSSGTELNDVYTDTIERVLADHPVECAFLFGSHARQSATPQSDIDIAVAFTSGTSAERLDRRVDLIVELSAALGTDAVDVTDLDSVRPVVGLSAIRTGIQLCGSADQAETYRDRFAQAVQADRRSHADRMREFDSVLEHLKGRV